MSEPHGSFFRPSSRKHSQTNTTQSARLEIRPDDDHYSVHNLNHRTRQGRGTEVTWRDRGRGGQGADSASEDRMGGRDGKAPPQSSWRERGTVETAAGTNYKGRRDKEEGEGPSRL